MIPYTIYAKEHYLDQGISNTLGCFESWLLLVQWGKEQPKITNFAFTW